jgi:hypothetical protein
MIAVRLHGVEPMAWSCRTSERFEISRVEPLPDAPISEKVYPYTTTPEQQAVMVAVVILNRNMTTGVKDTKSR